MKTINICLIKNNLRRKLNGRENPDDQTNSRIKFADLPTLRVIAEMLALPLHKIKRTTPSPKKGVVAPHDEDLR
jgi:hypothetical protein